VSASARPVVLVTGAAKRLGRAIARELATHGWNVAVHFHASANAATAACRELQELGAQAQPFGADLADEAACRALVPAVVEAFGHLDGLVNSASLMEHDEAASVTFAALERHWRINTGAPLLLAAALHEHLVLRDARGACVNLLDQKLWNPNPDALSYTLSKAALNEATTLLAQAFAPRLRVCGVAPGLTLGSPLIDEALHRELQARSPLGHGPQPHDVAAAVRFLLESPALTGTTLLVDCGQHLQAQPRDFPFLRSEATRYE